MYVLLYQKAGNHNVRYIIPKSRQP